MYFYGFNITNPYKEIVIEHLDELSEEVSLDIQGCKYSKGDARWKTQGL